MLVLGVVVTIIWILGLAVVVWLNLDKALELGLNEWGDFLAGGFAPLAFFWLVIGYFQQGKELRLSTAALKMQAEELRNSVEQQKELVKATYDDIAFAKAEAEQAKEISKRLAQPNFVLNGSRFVSYKDGTTVIWVSIINYGSDIKGVEVTIDENERYTADPQTIYNYQKWARDETIGFSALCYAEALQEIEVLRFNIVYLDGDANKSASYLWVDVRNGRAVGLREEKARVVEFSS